MGTTYYTSKHLTEIAAALKRSAQKAERLAFPGVGRVVWKPGYVLRVTDTRSPALQVSGARDGETVTFSEVL